MIGYLKLKNTDYLIKNNSLSFKDDKIGKLILIIL